jgi:demethylmenaquinone methyltransferase/2-methoxy-6-polyprenyl-1,4-benzoquinol methylase
LIDEFAPVGDVLELACGTGLCTRDIVRHADSVTALDASPRMLERARREVPHPKVTFVLADVFSWNADRAYDAVVFSAWLSHVPPDDRFDEFWQRLRDFLKPGGRVCFIDEDDRAVELEELHEVGGVPVARRRLADGRTFEVVKVLWRPAALEARLSALGWSVTVRSVGDSSLVGSGTPSRESSRP